MGKINEYTCVDCKKSFVTEDLDKGTTPFMLTCPICNGTARSCFYSCDQALKPDLFWFKPTEKQIKKQIEWELEWMGAGDLLSGDEAFFLQKEHIDNGGLVLGPDMKTIKRWGLGT